MYAVDSVDPGLQVQCPSPVSGRSSGVIGGTREEQPEYDQYDKNDHLKPKKEQYLKSQIKPETKTPKSRQHFYPTKDSSTLPFSMFLVFVVRPRKM